MSDLDLLPAVQLASLRLIVRGRSYSEVADALAIEPEVVQRNAQLAVSTIAGKASDALTQAERARVADWLLGETATEPLVEGSPAARAFAESASRELNRIEGARVPSLPVPPVREPDVALPTASKEPAAAQPQTTGKGQRTFSASKSTSGKAGPESAAGKATPEPTTQVATKRDLPEISRRGGILLLASAAVALLVGGLAIGGVFDGGEGSSGGTAEVTTPTQPSTTPGGSQQAMGTPDGQGGWTLRRRYTLKPVASGSKSLGVAGLQSKGSQNAMLVAGTGLPANATVGIWLTGGPQPALVGFQKVNQRGEFTAMAPVPKSAPQATRLVVTTESVRPGQPVPTSPGPVILSSAFST